MQRKLLEAEDKQLVVLRLFADELLGNCGESDLVEKIVDNKILRNLLFTIVRAQKKNWRTKWSEIQ